MIRWVRIGILLLVVFVLAGIAWRQTAVERGQRRCPAAHSFGTGVAPLGGARGFWTGLTEWDSIGCEREISALEPLVDVIPDYAPAHRALALAYACAGSSGRAIRAGEHYAELRPGEPDVTLLLASIYILAGFYDRALATLESGFLELDDAPCRVERTRGEIYVAKGMYGRAVESYLRFIEAASYELLRSDGWFEIGRVHVAQGRFDEAVERFEQSAFPDASDPRAAWGKSLAYALEGKTDLARAGAESIRWSSEDTCAIAPGSYELLMGRILMREGRWIEAVRVLEASVGRARVPERLQCLMALAEAYGGAGDPQGARGALEECFRVNPAHAEARYLSARLYEDQGEAEKAASEYDVFLEIWRDADSDLPLVADATRRLRKIRSVQS